MSNYNFKKSAQKTTSISHLMEGREKIKTKDIIEKYPDGITIDCFDIVQGSKGEYPVLTFSEDNTKFFNGGIVFQKIVKNWLDDYDGQLELCQHDLSESGGVKVQIEMGTTKSGNNITKVKIL